jgi:hypothetical protein
MVPTLDRVQTRDSSAATDGIMQREHLGGMLKF